MLFIGIDPGKSGAVVVQDKSGRVVNQLIIPTIGKEFNIHLFAGFLSGAKTLAKGNLLVTIEEVHAIYGATANSTFQLAQAFMMCKAVCAALRIPFQTVQPKKWQKEMFEGIKEVRAPGKKDPKTGKIRKGKLLTKPMALAASKRLFPSFNNLPTKRCTVPHDGLIDALLICEYGRRTNGT